jgi:SSS family transporter
VRVFAVAIVVGIALGSLLANGGELQRDLISIGIVTAMTLLYTFEGGMAAVIWTDVVQLVIYIGGTLVGVFTIAHLVPGGWNTIHQTAASAGKFRVFDFSLDFYRTYTFWSGLIGGAFLTTASHGTDQLIVQRLLAAKNEAQSKLALLSSGVVVLFQFWLFLLIGAMLWVFYRLFPPAVPFQRTDRIFPAFIVSYMPHGVSGLMIAAILAAAMSNLSAALNSLSSTTIVDFYMRHRPDLSEARRVLLSRVATVVWGCVLFVLAIASRHSGRVVELGLSIAAVAYGALLGVFLLGVLTRTANESGTMIGMAAGFCCNVFIWQGSAFLHWFEHLTGARLSALMLSRPIPFPWYVPIGSAITFVVGYSCSRLLSSHDIASHVPAG